MLTCAFVGVLAFASPGTSDVGSRLGFYVLAMAVAVVAVAAFFLVGLAVEGVVYAVENPGELVASQLLLYFLAAALICTGLGVWGLRHWREFASSNSDG